MNTKSNRYGYHKYNLKPCDPDFTIHVYNVGKAVCPTVDALRDMGQHAYIFNVEDDPVVHHYVTDVLDHYTWPVVTITNGADLIVHWEGHRPDMLELIPALRSQHTKVAA